MAQLNRYDTTNTPRKKSASPGLWTNVKKLFGMTSDDRERPLNPTLVSSVSQGGEFIGPEDPSNEASRDENSHEERVHRLSERRRINENPATTWPG